MKDLDKYRGCLIGGAAGDALGYAVEFLEDTEIFQKYGVRGITEYDLVDDVAQISDDTQMTLFTANGLLLGTTPGKTQETMESYLSCIARCYLDWLKTQTAEELGYEKPDCAWLGNVPAMNHSRAPGYTCIHSLISSMKESNWGSTAKPINDSKGCGGVMRVAPIGLYFEGKGYSTSEIDRIGAEAAALTHGHELGYIPAAALVHIIHIAAHRPETTLLFAVEDSIRAISELFPNAESLNILLALMQRAIQLSKENLDDLDAIRELGEGWVAEETLAIAVYCALKYQDDFDKALIAAVNHSGDSDSTGAVTGNILGAYLGLNKIPQKYLDKLELRDVILEIADDLFHDCQMSVLDSGCDEIWTQKYIQATYKPACCKN